MTLFLFNRYFKAIIKFFQLFVQYILYIVYPYNKKIKLPKYYTMYYILKLLKKCQNIAFTGL